MNMVQHSGSSGGGAVFDFSNSSTVMAILKALRAQEGIETAIRNEIRDLIFSFITSGYDGGVRQVIETRLLEVGITPELVKNQAHATGSVTTQKKSALKAGFSIGREVPRFDQSSVVSIKTVPDKIISETVIKKEELPTAQNNNLAVADAPSPTVKPPTIISTPSVSMAPSIPVSEKKPTPEPKITPTIPVSPKVQRAPSPVAEGVSAPAVDSVALLERIRVIKADINARAGNSVNLMAINKAVGTEYMSSLLEAMKQLSGGNTATITQAMKRLEIAYEQALSVIELSVPAVNTNQAQPSSAVSPNSTTINPVVQDQQIPQVPVPSQDSVSSSQAVLEQTPKPISVEVKVSADQINPPLGASRSFEPLVPKSSTTAPLDVSPTELERSASVQTSTSSSVPIYSSKLPPVPSVAMATPLRRVEELPTLAEIRNHSESGNPLYTQEISDGLEQLLSEWSIFRKSGILGTGPNASNHPLFKKLAPLKIPLIIAGRFEGATEAVRQSITDYMNGWRYEQGIVYDKEETFELYLRRVIRHIIDSQKPSSNL